MEEIKDMKCLTSYVALGKCLFTSLPCSQTHFYLSEVNAQRRIQALGHAHLSDEKGTSWEKQQALRKPFDLGIFSNRTSADPEAAAAAHFPEMGKEADQTQSHRCHGRWQEVPQ